MAGKRTWLREMRKEKELTLEEVATLAGISSQMLSYLESGTRDPSVTTAKRIGKVLKFRWFIFFDDDATISNTKKGMMA